VKDLKTFTGKTEKEEALVEGFGERVCYVINDLLNRELIKKDFRFKDPVFLEGTELEE
jgi:hypothetical protein